jgi:hypothetical protein
MARYLILIQTIFVFCICDYDLVQAKEPLKLKYCSYKDMNLNLTIDSSITEDKIDCLGSTDGAGHETITFKKLGIEILVVNIESQTVRDEYRRLKINGEPGFGYSPDKGALNAATDNLKKIIEFEK